LELPGRAPDQKKIFKALDILTSWDYIISRIKERKAYMSKFYGVIDESARRTQPTARGHHSIGTTAASWKGCVKVRLWEDHVTGDICFRVEQSPWHGHGVRQIIADGIVGREC
jgi:hypothetical protein